jgi:hypothetical protein
MSNIDRSLYIRRFNPFEKQNNFTILPPDGGPRIEERWIELGAYGKWSPTCRLWLN